MRENALRMIIIVAERVEHAMVSNSVYISVSTVFHLFVTNYHFNEDWTIFSGIAQVILQDWRRSGHHRGWCCRR